MHSRERALDDRGRLRLAAQVGLEHQPEGLALAGDEVEVGRHRAVHPVAVVRGRLDRPAQPVDQLLGVGGEQRVVEVELAREVLVQHRLAHPGALGDGVHRGGVVALRGEDIAGRAEQLHAAGAAGQPDPARWGRRARVRHFGQARHLRLTPSRGPFAIRLRCDRRPYPWVGRRSRFPDCRGMSSARITHARRVAQAELPSAGVPLADPAELPPLDPWRPRWPGRETTVGPLRVHVRDVPGPGDAADGPLAVYVHGMSGSANNWTDLAALLSGHAAGLAVDLPGFGRSGPAADGGYRPAAQAAVLIELLERLGRPVQLLGNSLGGVIALLVARPAPGSGALADPGVPGDARPAPGPAADLRPVAGAGLDSGRPPPVRRAHPAAPRRAAAARFASPSRRGPPRTGSPSSPRRSPSGPSIRGRSTPCCTARWGCSAPT